MDLGKVTGKKILITGGAGFIGSNLCEAFVEAHNEVVCLDNLSTGFLANITHLESNSNFTFVNGDIRDLPTCQKAMKGVDLVLHQAALGSVPRSINDPITTNQVNIDGFLNVLEAARFHKIKRVVYAASSSTYGDSTKLPKIESEIGMPLSPYAVTKYVNELYAHVYSNLYGLEIIGLRYFNVFGKRQTPDGAYAAAIPKFVRAFINHQSPEIHGDGEQTRDFTYIDNVIQMNRLAASTDNPEAIGQVYNVAYGDRTSLIQLIDIIKNALGAFDNEIPTIPLRFVESRAGDVRDSLADVQKAKTLLGYNPTHNLQQGIDEAIEWYWHSLKGN